MCLFLWPSFRKWNASSPAFQHLEDQQQCDAEKNDAANSGNSDVPPPTLLNVYTRGMCLRGSPFEMYYYKRVHKGPLIIDSFKIALETVNRSAAWRLHSVDGAVSVCKHLPRIRL